jgi:hypothetical protein
VASREREHATDQQDFHDEDDDAHASDEDTGELQPSSAEQPVSPLSSHRHHSAPLRPAPSVYIPLHVYQQQPHSLSLGNLEEENEVIRAAIAARSQAQAAAYSLRTPIDDIARPVESDESDIEDEVVEAILPDQDLLDI